MPLLIRGAIMIASIFAIGANSGNSTVYQAGSTHVSDLNNSEKAIYWVLVLTGVALLGVLGYKMFKKK